MACKIEHNLLKQVARQALDLAKPSLYLCRPQHPRTTLLLTPFPGGGRSLACRPS